MSIIFHNERINGIDWEQRVHDHRGKKFDCSGWHRHIWKANGGDAHKQCLPRFKVKTLEDFIVDGFKILNVQLERSKSNADDLFGNQTGLD